MTRFPLLLCLALAAASANALLIRPDREDAEYLELASRYASAAALNAPDGEGVLVASRWVLTAAHRAKALQQMKPAPKLQLAGRAYEIQSYFLHPEWKEGSGDIALLLLREPVKGIEPTPIYRANDENGKGLVVVGHGGTGVIGGKPSPAAAADRRARAAINTVDRVSERTLELLVRETRRRTCRARSRPAKAARLRTSRRPKESSWRASPTAAPAIGKSMHASPASRNGSTTRRWKRRRGKRSACWEVPAAEAGRVKTLRSGEINVR
jgi:hypothetical protein